MSPEALSVASNGINRFASAVEPIVMALGRLISGSREQEKKVAGRKNNNKKDIGLAKTVNTSSWEFPTPYDSAFT
jgi:hypothetical protein